MRVRHVTSACGKITELSHRYAELASPATKGSILARHLAPHIHTQDETLPDWLNGILLYNRSMAIFLGFRFSNRVLVVSPRHPSGDSGLHVLSADNPNSAEQPNSSNSLQAGPPG